MKKSYITKAVAVAAALFVMGMTACSGSGSPSASPSAVPAPTPASAAATPTPAAPLATAVPTPTPVAAPAAPTTITWGTHWLPDLDPNWVDPVTGQPTQSPDQIRAGQAALAAVQSQLNVTIQFMQYPNNVETDLLTSVLAGAPLCDLCLCWGGSQGVLLGQNIFQPLDQYQSLFSDQDSSWMFAPPVLGHNYMLNYVLTSLNYWPLVFNITDLSKVPALQVNGVTQYPTDMYKAGTWTWSAFQDYLTKVQAYYANVQAPDGSGPIMAFDTDYRFAVNSSMLSNGGAVYGANGLQIDSQNDIDAVSYIGGLINQKLLVSKMYPDNVTPQWTQNGTDFENGETVFTNMVPWFLSAAGTALAARSESMGLVPWPRPDSMSADDPNYQQVSTIGNTISILKGVDDATTKLSLEAYKLYWETYYDTLGNVSHPLDYLTATASTGAVANGFDILDPNIGTDIQNIYATYSPANPNEFCATFGIDNDVLVNIVGNSLYGINGAPDYATNVKAQLPTIQSKIDALQQDVNSSAPIDNIPPTVTSTGVLAVPVGTDLSTFDFSPFITITDNVDGPIPLSSAAIDTSATDTSKVGAYSNGISVTVSDAAGNQTVYNGNVDVYNPDNKTAPTITLADPLPTVTVNTTTDTINWGSFIASAVDADGLDVSASITADVSQLDTTTVGTYPVTLTVTDFAGNVATADINVDVVAASS